MKHIYLHIGTHKTGTTSIQSFLQKESKLLSDNGFKFYDGIHLKNNHVELFLAVMNESRDSFSRDKFNIGDQNEYLNIVTEKVQSFITDTTSPKLILSTEGLSLLRFPAEFDKLKSILQAERNKISVILYLRNKADFLESYKKQIKKRDRSFSENPKSVYYVENDTWLIDYDDLVNKYSDAFGRENLIILDYDLEVKNHNNVLNSFLNSIGITEYPHHILVKYYKNVTGKNLKKKESILSKILNKIKFNNK
jgi:hypothetical protein